MALAGAGCGADLWTKSWVFQWLGNPGERPVHWVVTDIAGIQTSLNRGALFGMGQGGSLFFAVVSIVAAIGIVIWHFRVQERLLQVALGLVTGGILGNLYDRVGLGKLPGTPDDYATAVRDWILIRIGSFSWPNFNIADSLLVCGAGLLLLHGFTAPAPVGGAAAGTEDSEKGSGNATSQQEPR